MIKRNIKGQFTKGNLSGGRFTSEKSKGNQHAKGNPPNKTSFKKGEFVGEKHPCWKGGIQLLKRDGVYVWIGSNKRARRARVVWEKVNGELPKGYIIYHLNGDRYNDDIDNLKAITRAELLKINGRK